jgi:hypothetical protein
VTVLKPKEAGRVIEIPLRIESTLNKREHWSARAKRASKQRSDAHAMVWFERKSVSLPCAVHLTRVAPRSMDDDNLAGGFKSVRDGVADALGINDNDDRVTWAYAQARGKPRQYAVRIEFQPA